jgi:hypothetical protein
MSALHHSAAAPPLHQLHLAHHLLSTSTTFKQHSTAQDTTAAAGRPIATITKYFMKSEP